MAAINHQGDAQTGLDKAKALSAADDVGKRCNEGGQESIVKTNNGRPVIREWEFANGPVIVFTKLDSCLGAIQKVGSDSVRGAHFSQWASGQPFDLVKFHKTMEKANFAPKQPIFYFGGSVGAWHEGFKNNIWMPQPLPRVPFEDAVQKCWIFEIEKGQLTCHSFG